MQADCLEMLRLNDFVDEARRAGYNKNAVNIGYAKATDILRKGYDIKCEEIL